MQGVGLVGAGGWMVKEFFFLWLPRSSLTTQTRFSNLTIPLRVLGLASKSMHFNFGLMLEPGCNL